MAATAAGLKSARKPAVSYEAVNPYLLPSAPPPEDRYSAVEALAQSRAAHLRPALEPHVLSAIAPYPSTYSATLAESAAVAEQQQLASQTVVQSSKVVTGS